MIVSRQNRRIKNIRRLRRCKGEHAILEGPHLLQEALRLGLALDEILATEEFMAGAVGRELSQRLPHGPSLVAGSILDELCDSDSPRGILAIACLPRGGAETLPPPTATEVLVVAEGMQDPGNVGALARSIEAAGGNALALTRGSANPNHARALRASAGSLLRLPTAVDIDPLRIPTVGDRAALPVVALVAHGGENLYQCDLDPPLALVVGAEGPGLSARMLAACDRQVTIPLAGSVESLNTAVAAAVVMFEVRRRQSPGTSPAAPAEPG